MVYPLDSLACPWTVCSIICHIYAWNMARGDWLKERFGLAMSMVGWYVVVPYLVGLCIINMRLFLLIISVWLYIFTYAADCFIFVMRNLSSAAVLWQFIVSCLFCIQNQ